MSDNEEGFFSMSELRLKHQALKEQKNITDNFALPSFTSTPRVNRVNFNTSKSFIASTPKRSTSIIPSRKRIIDQLSNRSLLSANLNADVSLNQSVLDFNSFNAPANPNKSHPSKFSVLSPENSFINRSNLEPSKTNIGSKECFNPYKKKKVSILAEPQRENRISHKVYVPINRNPYRYLGDPSVKKYDWTLKNKIGEKEFCSIIDNIRASLRREPYALDYKIYSVKNTLSSDSESEEAAEVISEYSSDSDISFHQPQENFRQGNEKPFFLEESNFSVECKEKETLESKIDNFLNSYKTSVVRSNFLISSKIPFDFSLKEQCSITSPFSLDFVFDENAENSKLFALTNIIPESHQLDSEFYKKGLKTLTKIYVALSYHVYPSLSWPSFMIKKFTEVLSKLKLQVKLTKEDEEVHQYFLSFEAEWCDTFKNLYSSCVSNVTPYFYYINDEFSAVFISQSASQFMPQNTLQSAELKPLAFLHGATPGLVKLLRKKGVQFNVSSLKSEPKNKFQTNGLSKGQLTKVRNALNPPKDSRLIFSGDSSVKDLYNFLLSWKNSNQEKHCQSFPKLISPVPFLNSKAHLPTVSFKKNPNPLPTTQPNPNLNSLKDFQNEINIQGLILPTAFKTLMHLLIETQNISFLEHPEKFTISNSLKENDQMPHYNEFLIKVKLKPHFDTLGLSGRWMFPLIPYVENDEIFDISNELSTPKPTDLILSPTPLVELKYGTSRFQWG